VKNTIKKKDRFVERRRWFIPRKMFVIVKVPAKTRDKLKGWFAKGDAVNYSFDANRSELLILNETSLDPREDLESTGAVSLYKKPSNAQIAQPPQ
jgi:hypothetical protein